MTEEELKSLTQEIGAISNYFEDKPWTGQVKLLKDNFDINSIKSPNDYLKINEILKEVTREARLLFLYAVFNRLCKESGKLYKFDQPYCAKMKYLAVMKNDETFYLQDEDEDFREIFTSEEFVRFIDDLYWKLYEGVENS